MCGAVMQDGFMFSESIARNIAVSDEEIDVKRMINAAQIANIAEYVDSLPLKYNTVIGQDGQGLSHGQCQRILIARAVYKNSQFLFFDEATNLWSEIGVIFFLKTGGIITSMSEKRVNGFHKVQISLHETDEIISLSELQASVILSEKSWFETFFSR